MTSAPENPGAVRKTLSKVIAMLENFSSIVILVMMVLTFVDVIGRYGFNKPIYGGTEIIASLLALTVFSGLGVINARDDHIFVELFEVPIRRLFSPIVYETIIQLFSIGAMILIASVLFEHAWEAYQQGKLTVVLEMPVYYTTAIVAVLAVISVLTQITGIFLKLYEMKNKKAGSTP